MPSFDIVSEIPWNEVENALLQTQKELSQRFDFKGTGAEIEKLKEDVVIRASTEDRVKAALDVFQEKLIKRKVSLKHVQAGTIEPSGKGSSRVTIKISEGIDHDHAKKIQLWIKESKMKVQASIQEKQIRVSSKKKDDLQECMAMLRSKEFDIELQFNNFRD